MGKERDLKKRTFDFALGIADFCDKLPSTMKGRHVAGQLFRASTAVAANYRGACRGRSKADFIAKLGIVIEEADESEFWLEFSAASKLCAPGAEHTLRAEAGELAAIFTQSQKTARANFSRVVTLLLLAVIATYFSIQH